MKDAICLTGVVVTGTAVTVPLSYAIFDESQPALSVVVILCFGAVTGFANGMFWHWVRDAVLK